MSYYTTLRKIKPETNFVYEYGCVFDTEITFPEIAKAYPDLCSEIPIKVFNIKKTCEKLCVPNYLEKDFDIFDESEYNDWGYDLSHETLRELINEYENDVDYEESLLKEQK